MAGYKDSLKFYSVTGLIKYSGRVGEKKSISFMRSFAKRFSIGTAYTTKAEIDGTVYPIVFRAISKSKDSGKIEELIKGFKTLYKRKYLTIEKVLIMVSE